MWLMCGEILLLVATAFALGGLVAYGVLRELLDEQPRTAGPAFGLTDGRGR